MYIYSHSHDITYSISEKREEDRKELEHTFEANKKKETKKTKWNERRNEDDAQNRAFILKHLLHQLKSWREISSRLMTTANISSMRKRHTRNTKIHFDTLCWWENIVISLLEQTLNVWVDSWLFWVEKEPVVPSKKEKSENSFDVTWATKFLTKKNKEKITFSACFLFSYIINVEDRSFKEGKIYRRWKNGRYSID